MLPENVYEWRGAGSRRAGVDERDVHTMRTRKQIAVGAVQGHHPWVLKDRVQSKEPVSTFALALTDLGENPRYPAR